MVGHCPETSPGVEMPAEDAAHLFDDLGLSLGGMSRLNDELGLHALVMGALVGEDPVGARPVSGPEPSTAMIE